MFVICIRVEHVASAEPIQEPEPQEEQAQVEASSNPEQAQGKPQEPESQEEQAQVELCLCIKFRSWLEP